MTTKILKTFYSEKEASDWMYNEAVVDEEYIDNYRFAFQDEHWSMSAYSKALSEGCCGYFDEEIMVNGRLATIGCNFGH